MGKNWRGTDEAEPLIMIAEYELGVTKIFT